MRIETLAVHAGHDVDAATSAVTPPIHLSTTFARETDGSYKAGFLYSRYANPNRTSLEQCLAALEGGADGIVISRKYSEMKLDHLSGISDGVRA